MKNQITCALIWMTLPLVSFSQNNWFVGFDHDFDAVTYLLTQEKQLPISHKVTNKLIRIETDQTEVTYLFNYGLLYRIDVKKAYKQKKTARKAFEGCMNYLQTINAKEVFSNEKKAQKRCLAYKGEDFYNLHLSSSPEHAGEVLLSSRHFPHMPLSEWEQYQHLVEQDGEKAMQLLEKKLDQKRKMAFY